MAAARSIPLVTVAFSGVLPERGRSLVLDDLQPLWMAEGLDSPSWADVYGQLYLHPFPESFGQRPDSPVVRSIRRDPAHRACRARHQHGLRCSEPNDLSCTPAQEPRCCRLRFRGAVVRRVAEMDVDAVATIGAYVDLDGLGALPGNVRASVSSPSRILGRASAVVSHGGAGTVLGAAAHGRPQAVVPLFADQWENGVAVTDAGCGIVLEPDRRSADNLGQALRTLLDHTSHRDAARGSREEMHVMPSVERCGTRDRGPRRRCSIIRSRLSGARKASRRECALLDRGVYRIIHEIDAPGDW